LGLTTASGFICIVALFSVIPKARPVRHPIIIKTKTERKNTLDVIFIIVPFPDFNLKNDELSISSAKKPLMSN
jgi:hypothetical protein